MEPRDRPAEEPGDKRPGEFGPPPHVPPPPQVPPSPPAPPSPPVPPSPHTPPPSHTPPPPHTQPNPYAEPPPLNPPTQGPPHDPHPAPIPTPLHPTAIALLNLTGLGLGYLLLRRHLLAALCCAATAALLFIALPADVDRVPVGVLVAYVVVLLLAAAHGAHRATRDRGRWPRALRAPVAVGLGVVLLAIPAGGAFAYESAHDEAVEQMLLDRLDRADRIVAGLDGQRFGGTAERQYKKALGIYRGLAEDHGGSKAADRLPDSLGAYYKSVAAPYTAKKYCDAVTPLRHLRTVPDTLGGPGGPGKERLGTLATWPDDRLATSLYACGTAALGRADATGPLGELLRTFPESERAAAVGPALRNAVDTRSAALEGSDPCPGVDELRALGRTAAALPADAIDAEALRATTDRAVERGVYACGVDQFKDADFTKAVATLDGFATKYPGSDKRDRAADIAVAAEIAAERPSAGRHLPPARSATGGGTVEFLVANLGPGALEVLYTGPTTGTLTLKDCPSCRIYATKSQGDAACRAGVTTYPRTTLRLPVGEYHFLYKRATVRNRADGARLSTAYRYTDCSFVTRGSAGLGLT
ncbi:hypothetical protein ABZ953_13925 [Streptomyces sp. NPDC046465]|uniref:hypothetical protein n=1 Tax=Streptomyces sp. NPDC046465 TaxID=3155810 RepID=UPI00340891F9